MSREAARTTDKQVSLFLIVTLLPIIIESLCHVVHAHLHAVSHKSLLFSESKRGAGRVVASVVDCGAKQPS